LVTAGPASLAVPDVTSIASIPRLVADAAGLADHPWQSDDLPAGIAVAQSDAPQLRTDATFVTAARDIGIDAFGIWRATTPSTCATDGRLKLVREGDDDWLYDLAADPLEVAPVWVDGRTAVQRGPIVNQLRAAVDAAAPLPETAAGGARRVGFADDAAGNLAAGDADLAAQLEALGYL
jgi:hypothetical protein